MNNGHIYMIQVLFATGIAIGSQVLNLEDKLKWLHVARYTVYIVTISAVSVICKVVYHLVTQRSTSALAQTAAGARSYVIIFATSVAALVLCEEKIFQQDFVFAFLGYLVVKYPEMAESAEHPAAQEGSTSSAGTTMKSKKTVNYGVGMACSYFEGYLTHILPSDGHKFVGFEENIRSLEGGGNAAVRRPSKLEISPTSIKNDEHPAVTSAILRTVEQCKAQVISTGSPIDKAVKLGAIISCLYFEDHLMHLLPSDGYEYVGFEENIRHLEDNEGVLFPVKKMFIVITKSFYSPPDLKEFNRGTDVPYLETFNILPEIKKSVAGVKDRIYHNTAYKIYRPPASPQVCLTVECASPLHTLYKVICNRRLYDELAEIDIEEVKNDFCTTLQSILNKSPECRGKCELIYYNHEDPTQNLAEILLKRVQEICPNFEEKIIARQAENILIYD